MLGGIFTTRVGRISNIFSKTYFWRFVLLVWCACNYGINLTYIFDLVSSWEDQLECQLRVKLSGGQQSASFLKCCIAHMFLIPYHIINYIYFLTYLHYLVMRVKVQLCQFYISATKLLSNAVLWSNSFQLQALTVVYYNFAFTFFSNIFSLLDEMSLNSVSGIIGLLLSNNCYWLS